MTFLEIVMQMGVTVPSLIAIWLVNGRSPKWACIFGLVSEVFWFREFYTHGQWGLFIVTFVYTFAWMRGFKTHWIDKR